MKAINISTVVIATGVLMAGMATSVCAQEPEESSKAEAKTEGSGGYDIFNPHPDDENPYLAGKEEFLKVNVDLDILEVRLEDLMAYISDQIRAKLGRSPSFVFKDEAGKIEVPNIVSKEVTVDNVFFLLERLLEVKFDVIDTNPTDKAEGFVLIQKSVDPRNPSDAQRVMVNPRTRNIQIPGASDLQFTRAFSVARLLNHGVTPEELNEAFEARWGMMDLEGEEEPMAKFHEASATMIVRGSMQRLEEAEEMIQLLLEKEEASRTVREQPTSMGGGRPEAGQPREENPPRGSEPPRLPAEPRQPGSSEPRRPADQPQRSQDGAEQPRGGGDPQGSRAPREPGEPVQSPRKNA